MAESHLIKTEAVKKVRECLASGRVVVTKHFRDELKNEAVRLVDAYQVLRTGAIYDSPEQDIKTAAWKYRIEGRKPGGL